MRTIIYKAIIKRLKDKKTGIRHFSLWNQNTEQLSKLTAFKTPAVFVEFEPIYWNQRGNSTRSADLRVRLHIVADTLATPEDGGKYQDKALGHLDLIERVSAAIPGLRGDGFNSFMLVESHTDHNHERVVHHEEVYITRVTDLSSQKTFETVEGVTLKCKIKQAP